MRKVMGLALLVAVVVLLASPMPSEARGGRVFIGGNIWLGPGFWGPWWWGPPHYYYYAPYYAPAPVIVQPPPVYQQPAPPPPQEPVYWYYCQNPQGYYPYVQQCPSGWTKVVPPGPPPAP